MAQNDGRILLSKEEADRKAEEKRNVVGIVFERMSDGIRETRTATSVEHIAAFFNSSNEGPNAKNKQDFGWRLAPADLIELEQIKDDAGIMAQIAQVYQLPPEEVPDYNVLKYMASKRFRNTTSESKSETREYEDDYDRRVREAREGKTQAPAKSAPKKAEPKTEAPVKTETPEKVEKTGEKADNSGSAK